MAVAPRERGRWETVRLYCLFAAFGGGASWFGTVLPFMEVPIYQRHLPDLDLSNRLELGYNAGTVPAAVFVACLACGWRSGRLSRVRGVVALLVVNLCCVALLCVAVPGSPLFGVPALAVAMFLGGSCGYVSQFLCVPYLVGGFENDLVGAFWTGDALTSVFAALVALAQRPAEPRFGPRVYVAATGFPVILASLAAFYVVETTGAGRLKGAGRGAAGDVELATKNPLLGAARDGDEAAGDRSPPEPPQKRRKSDVLLAPPPRIPAYLREALTWRLALVVFWSQFADWGMGDSVYPYACANADSNPDVEGCEMWSNELSLAASLVGCALASRVPLDGRRLWATLWLPTAVYTGWFGLLLYTAWASGAASPKLSERGVIATLVILRFLGPYARNVVPRLIQPSYAKEHHEDLPVFFGVVAVLGNVAGSLVATGLIGARRFHYAAPAR